ncbi:hypothetical protein ACPYPG_30175 [Streptomyces sp. FR-108]|uniref:hypothetical protein n=1 Tax=Streptomyces sp. FR-108 TaxID=3416665 RepID=UPI003CEB7DAD
MVDPMHETHRSVRPSDLQEGTRNEGGQRIAPSPHDLPYTDTHNSSVNTQVPLSHEQALDLIGRSSFGDSSELDGSYSVTPEEAEYMLARIEHSKESEFDHLNPIKGSTTEEFTLRAEDLMEAGRIHTKQGNGEMAFTYFRAAQFAGHPDAETELNTLSTGHHARIMEEFAEEYEDCPDRRSEDRIHEYTRVTSEAHWFLTNGDEQHARFLMRRNVTPDILSS